MWMLQAGGQLDLALEPVGADQRPQLGTQDLQRDGAFVPDIAREIDGSHPAAAELALDHVSVA
jgi:hypothetical protein